MVSDSSFRQMSYTFTKLGSVFSSVTKSNTELQKARGEAKRIIHALHKAQDKLDQAEVLSFMHTCIIETL